MVAWKSHGDIIRWWRTDVLGLSQQQVADRLSVRPTALSNWELGTRRISVDIEQIDKALEADGALAGLLWAFGTREGLEPSQVWAKTFPGPSMPVWFWLRSDEPRIEVEAEWGVFRLQAELDPGPNGVFVTCGASVEESPVVARTSHPCWFDFGRGELPASMPGAAVLNAIDLAQPSRAQGVFMDLFSAQMESKFATSHSKQIASLDRAAPRRVGAFFQRFTTSRRPEPRPWPPLPGEALANERHRFATLRRARGLSLAETAERLAATTDVQVSRDTLRRFENSTGAPHDRLLPVALDHVLGGNGHLAVSEIRSGQGSGMVRIPALLARPRCGSASRAQPMPRHRSCNGATGGAASTTSFPPSSSATTPRRRPPSGSWPTSRSAGPPVSVAGPGPCPSTHDWIPVSVDAANKALNDATGAVVDAIRLCVEVGADTAPETEGPHPAWRRPNRG